MKKAGLSLLLVLVLTLSLASAVSAQAGAGESPLPTPTATMTPPGDGGELPQVDFSAMGLSAIMAVVTSTLLAYVPGLAQKWADFRYKRELLAGIGLVVAGALLGLHYLGAIRLVGVGDFGWPVIWRLLDVWLGFIGGSQAAFMLEKRLRKPTA